MPDVFRDALEQALSPVQPGVGDGIGVSQHVVGPEVDGRNHSRLHVSGLGRRGVRALARIDRDRQLSSPPGGLRQSFQVGRRELSGLVGRDQQVVRLAPCVLLQRSVGALAKGRVEQLSHRLHVWGCHSGTGLRVARLMSSRSSWRARCR